MGMGIGAAMTGLRPIVEGMNMGFLLLAFNQVGPGKTAAAVHNMPHNCLSYVSLGHSRLWAFIGAVLWLSCWVLCMVAIISRAMARCSRSA